MKTKPFNIEEAIARPQDVRHVDNSECRFVRFIHVPEAISTAQAVGVTTIGDVYLSSVAGINAHTQKHFLVLIDDPIAPGRNPDKLTISQVGEGWRLAEESDIANPQLQMWILGSKQWENRTYSHDIRPLTPSFTYRVPTAPQPLGPEDFPPGTVVRNKKTYKLHEWSMITCVYPDRAYTIGNLYVFDNADFMRSFERLLPGTTTWLPCHK